MRRVALTGGIATGKSYVLERFRRLGVACVDADALAHGAMAPGTEATEAIAARFGAGVLDARGGVDRQALASIVFTDAAARRDLEAIVHPAVRRALHAALRGFELLGSPLAIAAIPLLYETGRAAEFDAVIATVCPEAQQIARLRDRGLSEAEARARLSAQMPAEEKASRADYVIRTDGSLEDTDRQVDGLWRRLSG
jgi:dephospho-CoA kinase